MSITVHNWHFLFDNKPIYIALSGGRDSVFLLDIIYRLINNTNRLNIIHYNHKWSDNSNKYEKLCQKLAHKYNIPIYIGYAGSIGQTSEGQAREYRYNYFENIVENNILITAHHENDQIETILMRIARGTSISGLIGIKDIRMRGNMNIYRPLLYTDKEFINKYINYYQLEYIDDITNNNTDIVRNNIRHNIIPLLSSIYSQYAHSIIRLRSDIIREDSYWNNIINEYINNEKIYNRQYYQNIHIAIRYRLLHKILSNQKVKNINNKMIEYIDNNIIKSPQNKNIIIELDSQYIIKILYYQWQLIDRII